MKTKILVLITFSFFFSAILKSQCINGVKSYPIYKIGAQLVNDFDNAGNEIVRIEYDLVFSSKESFRNLSSDWTYSIIGFADGGVKDLNIKVFEYDDLLEKWTLVAEDNSSESYGIVDIRPSVTALYKVEILVHEFYEGFTVARYGLMYVHD